MNDIHPTAIVEDGARIGENVRIGAFSMIGRRRRARGRRRHPSPRRRRAADADRRRRPRSFPSPRSAGGRRTPATRTSRPRSRSAPTASSANTPRSIAAPPAAAARRRSATSASSMIGAHVAHDCVLGEHVVLVNSATLGGHVEIGEHAILGGLAAVQQRCRIGAHAFIGGLTGVRPTSFPLPRRSATGPASAGSTSSGSSGAALIGRRSMPCAPPIRRFSRDGDARQARRRAWRRTSPTCPR